MAAFHTGATVRHCRNRHALVVQLLGATADAFAGHRNALSLGQPLLQPAPADGLNHPVGQLRENVMKRRGARGRITPLARTVKRDARLQLLLREQGGKLGQRSHAALARQTSRSGDRQHAG